MKVFVKLFAEKNLGDDLFLKILLERYPLVEFLLVAKETYTIIFEDYGNLKVYQNKSMDRDRTIFEKIYSKLEGFLYKKKQKKRIEKRIRKEYSVFFKEADIFLSVGGSIFMQPKRLPVYYNFQYYDFVREYFDRILFLGCNFGPYLDESFKNRYAAIFRDATDVCFRDTCSSNLFSNLSNVRCKPDIVFNLNYKKAKTKPNSIGFTIISARNGVDEESYFLKYAELVKFYIKNGYEVFLFSFCQKQGDEHAIESIVNRLESKTENVKKIFYDGNINEFLSVYSSMEKMFCGRFHSMILSMLFNQKICPIVYNEKMSNVLQDIDFKGEFINLDNFIHTSVDNAAKIIENNQYDIQSLISESEKQFEILDSQIK